MRTHDLAGKKIIIKDRYASAVVIPVSGKIEFTQQNRIIIADSTHPVFLPARSCYVNRCIADADSYMFNMRIPEPAKEILSLPPSVPGLAAASYDKITMMLECGMPVQLILSELLVMLGQMLDAGENHEAETILLPSMKLMLREYADPDLCVSVLAAEVGLSPSWFRQLFLRHYGCTPFHYLTQIRMNRAAQLLLERLPVKDVALSVGYRDVYQFSRAFKRRYGCPPSLYSLNSSR